jgi:hypothetical protein
MIYQLTHSGSCGSFLSTNGSEPNPSWNPIIIPYICLITITNPSYKAFVQSSFPLEWHAKVWEVCLFFVAVIKPPLGKCLPFNTRAHNESGLVIKRHPCLPNIAILNSLISLKPIPPTHFGRLIWVHRLQ